MTIVETLAPNAQVELQLPEGKRTIRAERSFLVSSSTPLTEAMVLAAGPALGSAHPSLQGMMCVAKSARPQRSDLRAWELSCSYVNASVEWQDNPLLRPPVITWANVQYEEDLLRDIAGRAVLNSAGDYFDPPLKVQRSRWQVSYKRNRASVPSWITNYADAINSDQFVLGALTIKPRCAKLDKIEIGPLQIENDVAFYEVSYTFTLQRESWQPSILDQGLYEVVNGERRRIRNAGEPVTEPVLLDGRGRAIEDPAPHKAVFLRHYKAYYELPFSVLL